MQLYRLGRSEGLCLAKRVAQVLALHGASACHELMQLAGVHIISRRSPQLSGESLLYAAGGVGGLHFAFAVHSNCGKLAAPQRCSPLR